LSERKVCDRAAGPQVTSRLVHAEHRVGGEAEEARRRNGNPTAWLDTREPSDAFDVDGRSFAHLAQGARGEAHGVALEVLRLFAVPSADPELGAGEPPRSILGRCAHPRHGVVVSPLVLAFVVTIS